MNKIITLFLISISSVFASNPLPDTKEVQSAMVLQSAFRKIYKEANPSVVRIETEQIVQMAMNPFFRDPMFRRFFNVPNNQNRSQKKQGLGSGFIISKSGYIVTNYHVVGVGKGKKKYVDKIKIKLVNGKEYSAKVVGSDPSSDLAVLKIEADVPLKVAYIGNSDKVEVGDFAIAIGNPYGLSSTFTLGVVSSKGQEIHSPDGIPRIQTDAPINPGNSGGPLLNIKGEVIGINQMIYSQSGGSVGIGFAIPINYAMNIINRLKRGEKIKHGYLGVQIIPDPNPKHLKELGLKTKIGLLIDNVKLGSPAFKAGIRAYDFITHIDGKVITKFSQLKAAVVKKGVGHTMQIRVIRNGKSQLFKVQVGEVPSSN